MVVLDPIDELMRPVLELPEGSWRNGIDELCARHQDRAAEIRRRFALLCSLGLSEFEAPSDGFPIPERLGEFELTERLGQGGMGVVYAARQQRLGRTVALKLVRPEQLYFAGARERFQREIAAVAKLSHPGIVSVFSVGEEQGIPFLAMELLRGASLDDIVGALAGRRVEDLSGADLARVVAARAGVPVERPDQEPFAGGWTTVCTAIARRLAQALAHAHHNGVVHRDIKPSNVIVTPEGRVVLLDFGLAQPAGVDRMTRDGSQVGSLPYMAPEQLRGEVGDVRTDVYGVGVLLREILTLQQPFLTASPETTRHRILQGEGRRLVVDNRSISWELATVCAQATELEPRRRYLSAADLADDLDNVLSKRSINARPAGVARRGVRWAQRRPSLATGLVLGTLIAIGTPTAIAVGIAGQRDRARMAEIAQSQKAFEANLAAAYTALQLRDVVEARRRLEACPPALRGFEWQHLSLAIDGSLATLRGHQSAVTAVAMTPDAALLASGSEDGRVRLWDLQRGVTVHEFTHHQAGLWQITFTADGQRLLLHDVAGHTSVVDVATRAVRAERQRSSTQDAVSLGIDGCAVLASLGGWRILELDPELLTVRREIELEQIGVAPQQLMLTDGRHLASVSVSELDVWDLRTGRVCLRLPGVVTGLAAMNVSAAGDRLALANEFGRVVIVEIPSGRVSQVLSDQFAIRDVAFDRSGKYLAAGGMDGAVRSWDLATGRLLGVRPGHDGLINCVAFSGARMLIATAGEDQTVRLWSPFGSPDHQILRGHVGVVTSLALTPAADRLVSASQDGSVRVWDTGLGMPLFARTATFMHHVNRLAVAGDGRTAFASSQSRLTAVDLASPARDRAWDDGRGWIHDLACAGKDVLLVADQSGCALFDGSGQQLRALHGLDGPALTCAVDAEGAAAFAGSAEGKVLRWDLDADHAGLILCQESSAITDLAFGHEDGRLFMLSGNMLQCRDAGDGTVVWQRSNSSRPLSIALGLGSRVVSGHQDGSVVFWDARSGEPLLTRKLGDRAVSALVSDVNGAFVAAGCEDGLCHLLRATATNPPEPALRAAGTCAAMVLHAELRHDRTRDEVLTAIDGRQDLDPELRDWMRAAELCCLPVSWGALVAGIDTAVQPGLPAERHAAARRIAEAHLTASPGDLMAVAVVALTSARLGDFDRALAVTEGLTDAELASRGWVESTARAGRALARHACGQHLAAGADLARLAVLAAQPGAFPSAVSLWREVEAALAQ